MGPLAQRILWVRGLRGVADGFVAVLLPVYLSALGMSPIQVGAIATATLLGSGLMTLALGMYAHRLPYRHLLLLAAGLMAATGAGFAALSDFWPLLLIAAIGTLNPSSGDVSVFLPLEHALLSGAAQARARTELFARYSMIGTLAAASGSLLTGLPALLASQLHMPEKAALQLMFVAYACIGMASALIYRGLPLAISGPDAPNSAAPLRRSKRTVYVLAALFSLDAFGGGFIAQALLVLWLFQKFQLSPSVAGLVFFAVGVLAALSYMIAVRIADRFGLVNTMVFTHLASSLALIAVPFMPTLGGAIGMLFVRSALSQMDVPTRSAFVMNVVAPEERAAAASFTSVPRSLAAATSPVLAGLLLSVSDFGWPLLIAGVLKMIYDLLLYAFCRSLSQQA